MRYQVSTPFSLFVVALLTSLLSLFGHTGLASAGPLLCVTSLISFDANQATRWRMCAIVAAVLDTVLIQPALEVALFRSRSVDPDAGALERARVHARLGAVMQRV